MAGTFFYKSVKTLFRAAFAIYNRLSVFGLENIPDCPVVVASNHASHIDPPLVGCIFPRPLRYLAKKELFAGPVMGSLITHLGAISVDRSDKLGAGAVLKMLLERLEAGESVLVFPEGSRSKDGRIAALEGGAAFLASKAGVPIVPVYVGGSFAAFPPGSRFPTPKKLTATFGAAIYPTSDGSDKERREVVHRALEDALRGLERAVTGR